MNQEGLKVAIIERHLIGGTRVNVGCTPTKTMVGSAGVAAFGRRAKEFGIVIEGPIRADMKMIKARKDKVPATRIEASLNGLRAANEPD